MNPSTRDDILQRTAFHIRLNGALDQAVALQIAITNYNRENRTNYTLQDMLMALK